VSGSCEHGDEPSGTEELLLSQKGLCFVKLVVSYVAAVSVLL